MNHNKNKSNIRTPSLKLFATFAVIILGSLATIHVSDFISFSNAHAEQNCSLPVCDVESKLNELRTMSQGSRYEYLKNLRTNYTRSEVAAELENLVVFGQKAAALLTDIKEEDWLVREAAALADNSIFNLCRWVYKDGTRLTWAFKQISGQAQRFAVISLWKNNAATLSNATQIEGLLNFANVAEKISLEKGDDDYIPEAARSLAGILSSTLMDLRPIFEGAYDIVLETEPRTMRRLIVVNTDGPTGISASIIDRDAGYILNTFPNLTLSEKGQVIVGASGFDSQFPSRVEARLSNDLKSISGFLTDPHTMQPVSFRGVRRAAVNNAITTGQCTLQQLVGSYSGSFNGIKGTISLGSIDPTRIAGTYFASDESLRLTFSNGKYRQHLGRLTLTSSVGGSNALILRIAAKMVNNHCELSGTAFSAFNGVYYKLRFSSLKDSNR
jgi:hypothetical protein